MASRPPESDHADEPPLAAVFPAFVTMISVLAGLYLYVHSTRPALQEREEMDQMERYVLNGLVELRVRFEALEAQGRRIEFDHEALVVELDRLGISFEEADRRVAELLAEEADRPAASRLAARPARSPATGR